jgi:hypothetical protein
MSNCQFLELKAICHYSFLIPDIITSTFNALRSNTIWSFLIMLQLYSKIKDFKIIIESYYIILFKNNSSELLKAKILNRFPDIFDQDNLFLESYLGNVSIKKRTYFYGIFHTFFLKIKSSHFLMNKRCLSIFEYLLE